MQWRSQRGAEGAPAPPYGLRLCSTRADMRSRVLSSIIARSTQNSTSKYSFQSVHMRKAMWLSRPRSPTELQTVQHITIIMSLFELSPVHRAALQNCKWLATLSLILLIHKQNLVNNCHNSKQSSDEDVA